MQEKNILKHFSKDCLSYPVSIGVIVRFITIAQLIDRDASDIFRPVKARPLERLYTIGNLFEFFYY